MRPHMQIFYKMPEIQAFLRNFSLLNSWQPLHVLKNTLGVKQRGSLGRIWSGAYHRCRMWWIFRSVRVRSQLEAPLRPAVGVAF